MDYKDTLLMPNTNFPMRGNLGVRELEFQARWQAINLYEKVLEKNKDNEPFILHDGPPYANGDIHIGHAFQKILKDITLRYQTMMGKYTPYIPGWDTHGLPIESAVTKLGVNRKEISVSEFRQKCREFAVKQVDRQRDQFKRLGILGDWDNPYLTLDKTFVADQIRVFAKMVQKGLIYKGLKPIYWSPSSESALAEAEIEYKDKQSISAYVKFDLIDKKYPNTSLIIWTTTPWTLPANLAVCVNPDFTYVMIKHNNWSYIVAKDLVKKVCEIINFVNYEVLAEIKGSQLESLVYQHPFYDRQGVVILGDHVTSEDGTGLVHTAPGHGEDDYVVCKKYNLPILCPVDDKGHMTKEAYQYEGLFYEKANTQIVQDLANSGHLLTSFNITHSYPHDWRTMKPVIFRATPQWFASVKDIKDKLINAIENDIDWIPTWGEVRLKNMVENRDDWVISRQRTWGVPIPIFYDKTGKEVLDPKIIEHVANLFEKHGTDIWYDWDNKDLLPKGSVIYPKREKDILDVWFDSGTSFSVLERRGLPPVADLYLEGSDQYRGWFNSSLTTSICSLEKPSYKRVVSHGFVLDGQGRKMSKSVGNVVDPLAIIKQNGADLLRMWVANVYFTADVRISNDLLTQVSEMYRKIRNTLRFMLANISDLDVKKDYIAFSMRDNLNRAVKIKFNQVADECLKLYENYEFEKILKVINPYIINDLSSFYLDYTKDILYIEGQKSFKRIQVQSTIYDICLGLLQLLTPIIPHTTSEAFLELPYQPAEDIYLTNMPYIPFVEFDGLETALEQFFEFKDLVYKQLEIARDAKLIGKSLQALVKITLTNKEQAMLEKLDILSNLAQVLIVSQVKTKIGKTFKVEVLKAQGSECARCWNVVDKVNVDGICERCSSVLKNK